VIQRVWSWVDAGWPWIRAAYIGWAGYDLAAGQAAHPEFTAAVLGFLVYSALLEGRDAVS
jgi:hypothetical protein